MKRVFAAALALSVLTGAVSVASAQDAAKPAAATPNPLQGIPEPSLDQLELARKLVDLTGTSRTFDELLPNIADRAKTTFIRSNPQMQLGIIDTVDKVALELVEKRADLDNNFAHTWALAFTQDELQQLVDFYSSDLGKKLAAEQPQILGMQMMYAERWSTSIAQEMAKRVNEKLHAAAQAETASMTGSAAGVDASGLTAPVDASGPAVPAPAAATPKPQLPAPKPKK